MMMISLEALLTFINTIILIVFGIIYFKKNYVIMTTDEFQAVSQFIDEHSAEEEASRELAGGTGCSVGFGADYLEDNDDENDEEE
jgi:hypothetical protein